MINWRRREGVGNETGRRTEGIRRLTEAFSRDPAISSLLLRRDRKRPLLQTMRLRTPLIDSAAGDGGRGLQRHARPAGQTGGVGRDRMHARRRRRELMQPGPGRSSPFRSSGCFGEAGSALEGVSNVRGPGLVWSFEGPIRQESKTRVSESVAVRSKRSRDRLRWLLFAIPSRRAALCAAIRSVRDLLAVADQRRIHRPVSVPAQAQGRHGCEEQRARWSGPCKRMGGTRSRIDGITGTASFASGSHSTASGDESTVS